MKEVRLGMIGFGNVGQGFVEIIHRHSQDYQKEFGIQFRIVAVCDSVRGSIYRNNGFTPQELLDAVKNNRNLTTLPGDAQGWDAITMIEKSGADAIAEISFTNLETGEPASSFVEKALSLGKHVVTSNKGPVALNYRRLKKIAEKTNVLFGVEGTVMSGTPALRVGMEILKPARIHKVQGIFNGTTNYILTKMDAGMEYSAALAEAQALGYAEANPAGDVEGFDAAGKVVILANLLMDASIGLKDVQREGITAITKADVAEAQKNNETWKLIGMVEQNGDKISASVSPRRLSNTHPLSQVNGATNAVAFSTELMGEVTLIGAGAGRLETGFALLSDLLDIYRR